MAVKLISANIQGLGNATKRRAIFNYYRQRCDILCLQETHSTEENSKYWLNEWGGKIIFSHGQSDSRGVAILINPRLSCEISKTFVDQAGRIVLIEIKVDSFVFSIGSLYAPNQDSPRFFLELLGLIQQVNENIILMADYNLVLEPEIDSKNVVNNNEKARKMLMQIMEEMM